MLASSWLWTMSGASFYLKAFTLRGTNNDAEVWVANNINFPTATQINPVTGTRSATTTAGMTASGTSSPMRRSRI